MSQSELNDDLYRRFRELVLNRCGLHYADGKRVDLAHRLSMALQKTGHQDLEALYAEAVAGGPTWDTILEHLTIGETYFFRNEPQFAALRQRLLPDLIARRRQARELRIWSAGCASGEEPYSIAMLLWDLLPQLASWQLTLLATDINEQFLARARTGLYGEWSFRDTPHHIRDRFFQREGTRWRIMAEIRQMVHFFRLNLAEPCYPSPLNGTTALDLILCRNVTIYFDEQTTRRLAARLYQALAPGGWLIVGHAEPHAAIYQQFEAHNFPGTVIYRKPLDAPPFATAQQPPVARPRQVAVTGGKRQAKPPARAARTATKRARQRPDSALTRRFPSEQQASRQEAVPRWDHIVKLLSRGDRDAAEPLLRRVLQATPHHTGALLAIGRICADRGELEPAERHLRLALEHEPLLVEAHSLLAQVYQHRDDLEAALSAYRRALFLAPDHVPALIGIAGVWQRLGRRKEAQRCYHNALRRLSSYPPAAQIAELEGITVAELIGYIRQQLQ